MVPGVSPSLIIYVTGRFCFAITVPSDRWSTKRHRDSVAKYLDDVVVDLLYRKI